MVAGVQTRRGFALIVVLGALSIIGILSASSATRLVARMGEISTEERIARIAQERAAMVRLASEIYGAGKGRVATDSRYKVPWLDGEAELWLQDVGGLVDLNAAGDDLLETLAEALNIAPEALEEFQRWRRTPRRLQSVADFSRVAGVSWQVAHRLQLVATVRSGRAGFSPEHAPDALLSLLNSSGGNVDAAWRSLPSGSVYQVRLQVRDHDRILGVISYGANTAKGRILEMN